MRDARRGARVGSAPSRWNDRRVTSSNTKWLTLIYKVPSEPTRLRASVWRKLKATGAVYLQNSVATLPYTKSTERALRALRNEIEEKHGGTAVLLAGTALAGNGEILGLIEAARNDEYEEIRDKCEDFLRGIDKELAAQHFTYGELEENEEDLTKLRNWFDKVVARDLLGASGRGDTADLLARCAAELNAYAEHVYAAEDV